MAFVLLQAPLKYGGNGPIASPSKAQQGGAEFKTNAKCI